MKFLTELFKSNAQRAAELAAQEAAIRAAVEEEHRIAKLAEEEALAAREAEAARIRKEVEESILKDKMESTTPWYEAIIGAEDAPFIKDRYRWNQAFIKDLIKKGYAGETDSEVFQAYLDRQVDDERKRIVEEERNKRRLSAEPWVEVIGDKIDEDGRIEMQLDWNAAFVKYLRLNGFRGATDEVLVQNWLAALEKDNNGGEYD